MSIIDLSRRQFGITTVYHFLFAPLTIGIVFLVAGFQTAWFRTGHDRWLKLNRFYGRLFLINFAGGRDRDARRRGYHEAGRRRGACGDRAVRAGRPHLRLHPRGRRAASVAAAALSRDLLEETRDRTVLLITHRTNMISAIDQVTHLQGRPAAHAASAARSAVPSAIRMP